MNDEVTGGGMYIVRYRCITNLNMETFTGKINHFDRGNAAKKVWKICKLWKHSLEELRVMAPDREKPESSPWQFPRNFSRACTVWWTLWIKLILSLSDVLRATLIKCRMNSMRKRCNGNCDIQECWKLSE